MNTFLAVLTTILASFGQLLMKIESPRVIEGLKTANSLIDYISIFITPMFVSGIVLYAGAFLVMFFTLSKLPLNIFCLISSISYIITLLIAYFILGETLNRPQLIGATFILVGVFIVSGAQKEEDSKAVPAVRVVSE